MNRSPVLRNFLLTAVVAVALSQTFVSTASAKLTTVASGRDVWVSLSIHDDFLYWSRSQNGVRLPKSSIYRTYLPDMTTTKVLDLKRGELVTWVYSGATRLAIETGRYVGSANRSVTAESKTVYGFDLATSALVKLASGTSYTDNQRARVCGSYPSLIGEFGDAPLYTVRRSQKSMHNTCLSTKTSTEFFSVPGTALDGLQSPGQRLATVNGDAYSAGYFAGELIYASGREIRAQRIGQKPQLMARANKFQVPIVQMHESGQTVTSFLHIGKNGYVDGFEKSHVFTNGLLAAPSRNFGGSREVTPCGDHFLAYTYPRADRIDSYGSAAGNTGGKGTVRFSKRNVGGMTCDSDWVAFASATPGNRDIRILATRL